MDLPYSVLILCVFLNTLTISGGLTAQVSAVEVWVTYLMVEQSLWEAYQWGQSGTVGQKDSVNTGLFGRILSKKSSSMPEPWKSSEGCCAGSHGANRIPLLVTENIMGRNTWLSQPRCSLVWSSLSCCIVHSFMFTVLLLRIFPQGFAVTLSECSWRLLLSHGEEGQPCPIHPFAYKALALPVTHEFLF